MEAILIQKRKSFHFRKTFLDKTFIEYQILQLSFREQ